MAPEPPESPREQRPAQPAGQPELPWQPAQPAQQMGQGQPHTRPADEPLETSIREYRSKREYERDVRHRRRDGWRVVSVLQRPGRPAGWRRVATGSKLSRPETEYLVTYNRVPRPPERTRPLQWLIESRLPGGRSYRWLWLLALIALTALLAYGLLDFFSDAMPF